MYTLKAFYIECNKTYSQLCSKEWRWNLRPMCCDLREAQGKDRWLMMRTMIRMMPMLTIRKKRPMLMMRKRMRMLTCSGPRRAAI